MLRSITRLFVISVCILILAGTALSTAQYPDKLIYNGNEYRLHSNPMQGYFKRFPDKKPTVVQSSSALDRGYVATFEIVGSEMFLKDIEVQKPGGNGWTSALSEVVPDNKPLKIDWYSGILIVPLGEVVNYVNNGYFSTYERYLLLEMAAGDFKRARDMGHGEYAELKVRQFDAWKKTPEYTKLVQQMKKDERRDDDWIEEQLRFFVMERSSKLLVD